MLSLNTIIIIKTILIMKMISTSELSKKANLGDELVPAPGEDCWRPMFNPEEEKTRTFSFESS